MTPDCITLLRHENAFSVYASSAAQQRSVVRCRSWHWQMIQKRVWEPGPGGLGIDCSINVCFFIGQVYGNLYGNLVDAASAQPYGVQCHKSDYNLHPSLTCLRIAQDMGIKQHSSFDILSMLKWSLPWYNIPNGLACRPNPSQCSDKQPMLRDIPKHKKWQWIRWIQPMAITESLRVWTAASSYQIAPRQAEKKPPRRSLNADQQSSGR